MGLLLHFLYIYMSFSTVVILIVGTFSLFQRRVQNSHQIVNWSRTKFTVRMAHCEQCFRFEHEHFNLAKMKQRV